MTMLISSAAYYPLDHERDQIRLLVLQPGEGGAPVEVELICASLADDPEYEALSYVWGSPEITSTVHLIVPEAPTRHDLHSSLVLDFQVTTNLESALRHLRRKEETRVLWADALCINQNNATEKIHQIRCMGDIYRKANRVCLWIGDEADNSDQAMELINTFHWPWTKLPERTMWYNGTWTAHWRALTYLVCRPYFTRRWIVQETALASSSIVHCGTRSTSWRALCKATMSLEGLIYQYRINQGPSRSQILRTHPFRDWNVARGSLKAWREGIAHVFDIEWALRTIVTQQQRPVLKQLLHIFRFKAVTDPRDAVYALLSLSKEAQYAQLEIEPSATFMDVFRETTKFSIRITQSLDIICQGFGFSTCSHPSSWVPRFYAIEEGPGCRCVKGDDLTMENQPEEFGSPTESLDAEVNLSPPRQGQSPYRASDFTVPNVSYEGPKLITKGFILDRVQSVLEPYRTGQNVRQIPRAWRDSVLALESVPVDECHQCLNESSSIPTMKFEAFWRTLITGRVPVKGASGTCSLFFQRWCEGDMLVTLPSVVAEHKTTELRPDAINRAIWNSIGGRRFIITESIRIGLAYERVHSGDLVCILFGCSVPVILRPAINVGHAGLFNFIGETYIHGVMNGGAMKGFRAGKYEEQDFNII